VRAVFQDLKILTKIARCLLVAYAFSVVFSAFTITTPERFAEVRRACISLRRSRTERFRKDDRQEPHESRGSRVESVRSWRGSSSDLLGPTSLSVHRLSLEGDIFILR